MATVLLAMFGVQLTVMAAKSVGMPRLSYLPPSPPTLRARAAVLLDASSGQLLHQSEGYVKNFPASTTKVLTALAALEHGRPNDIVAVSDRASGEEGTSCYLQPDEKQRLRDLIACMLVASGNDAADAIAEHLAGDLKTFSKWMTDLAFKSGARSSNFANPSGLHDDDHYVTAFDLALIARAAFASSTLADLATLPAFELIEPGGKVREFYTHNALLQSYPGAGPGKIGFTDEAGHTLVQSARHNDISLIGVVLGAASRADLFYDMTQLLDFGFSSFQTTVVARPGESLAEMSVRGGTIERVPVLAQRGYSVLQSRHTSSQRDLEVVTRLELPPMLEAPVQAGQVVGQLAVSQGSRNLGTVDLVVGQTVALSVPTQVTRWRAAKTEAPSNWGATATAAGIGLLIVLVLRTRMRRRRRRRRLRHQSVGRSQYPGLFG